MLKNIIGVNEASEITGLSAGTIKNYCADGKIAGKKVGNTWIIDKIKLESDYKMKRVYEELLKVVDESQMSRDGHYLSYYNNVEDFKEQTDPESYEEILKEFDVDPEEIDSSFITLDSAGSTGGFVFADPSSAFDDVVHLMESEPKYKGYLNMKMNRAKPHYGTYKCGHEGRIYFGTPGLSKEKIESEK